MSRGCAPDDKNEKRNEKRNLAMASWDKNCSIHVRLKSRAHTMETTENENQKIYLS